MIWISAEVVQLNPVNSMFLGCGSGSKVSPENLLDNLEANILVVWSRSRSKRIVIISVDTLFLGPSVSNSIIDGLSNEFGPEEIFLAATHTHTAPMIDETKPLLGTLNMDYARLLVTQIVEVCLRLAKKEPVLASMNTWKPELGGVVSRRLKRLVELSRNGIRVNVIIQRPNLLAQSFIPQATLAEFTSLSGELLAVLAVVPCHPVAYRGIESLSADVPGALRHTLRSRSWSANETPFIFLQGASGDLNPYCKPKWLAGGLVSLMDQIVNGSFFATFTQAELYDWAQIRVREMWASRKTSQGAEALDSAGEIGTALYEYPLNSFLETAIDVDTRTVSIHRLEIEDLSLVGASAELTYALKMELLDKLVGSELVGCLRDSFGYIASSYQTDEGGYEADGHQERFSITHRVGPPLASLLSSALEQTRSPLTGE